jgi:hypothetical protein
VSPGTYRRLGLALGAVLALVLSGCQPELQVALASGDERLPNPSFTVRDPATPGERPRYNTIKVVEASGTLVWHLRAEPFGDTNSADRFTYGIVLPGFIAVVDAQPLQPGKQYTVFVLGKKTGSLRITVNAGEQVSALDP